MYGKERYCCFQGSCSVATSVWSSLSWRRAAADRHSEGRSCSKHVSGSSNDPDYVCSSFGLAPDQPMTCPVKTRSCQRLRPSNSASKALLFCFIWMGSCVLYVSYCPDIQKKPHFTSWYCIDSLECSIIVS